MNAAKNPTNKGMVDTLLLASPPFRISLALAPMMGIKTIRKEKRAALFLSTPQSSATAMVEPEREMPGSTANACAIPIMNAFDLPTSIPS